MKKLTLLTSIFLFTGCLPTSDLLSVGNNLNENQSVDTRFKTNQINFMNSLKENSTQSQRDDFLDEFILKSDMQCQKYLNNPLKSTQPTDKESSLYMNLFDTVSSLFGVSLVTNTAKAVFLNNNENSSEEKEAYANALSPEIRKGVEIGRARYAKQMLQKKGLSLKQYSINNLREDLLKYDKQCNDAYGLIEINRALKEMQNSMYHREKRLTASPLINPKAIKAKVEEATKEVKEKKIEKKKEALELKKLKENVKAKVPKPVAPTQPKPADALLHHDSVPNLPHSTQP